MAALIYRLNLQIVREIVTCVTYATQTISVSLNCRTPGENLSARIDQHLGAKIVEARKRLGLSQRDVAVRSDISTEQLEIFEHGSVRIPALAIANLSRALGVTPGWFYAGLPGQETFDRVG